MIDRQKFSNLCLFFFLLFIVAISYSNTLYSPFILDDYSAFLNNKKLFLQDFSFESLLQLSKTRFGYARSIPIASFAINHYIGQGESIIGYHVTNILVHLLTTLSVGFLLSGLLKTRAAQGSVTFFRPGYFVLAICGLWALSPLQTNAVTYLVQRMTSMAALFFILACAFYIQARLVKNFRLRFLYSVSCLLAACCSFLSKENSWILPLAVCLIEFMLITPDLGSRLLRKIRWYHLLVVLLVILLVLPLAISYLQGLMGGYSGRHFTLSERLYTELRIVVFYMSLLLLPLPARMNLEHDFPLSTSLLAPPTTLFSLILIVWLLCIAIYLRRRQPLVSFGIFWFFLNLLIESTIVPLELIFEHRLYLPSVGFFLAFISILDRLFAKYGEGSHPEIKKIVFLLFVIVLSISSVLTSLRNNDWRDRLSVYEDSMEKSPAKSRAVSNYAMALGKAGQYDECAKYGMKVQELGEQGYEDYMNSATNTLSCLLLNEKSREAVETGEAIKRQILQKNLNYIAAGGMHKYMFNLGMAYKEEKQYAKAYEAFQVSLFRAPSDIKTFRAINKLFLQALENEQDREDLGLSEDATEIPVRLARIAYNYRQYDYAAQYLANAAEKEANPEVIKPIEEKLAKTVKQNGLKAFESNIQNNPTYKNNLYFRLYLKAVDYILRKYRPLKGAPAGWLLERAQRIDPGNPFIPVYRARWLMANNQGEVAKSELEEYTENNKNFVPALELLSQIYKKNNNHAKSVSTLAHILDIYHGHGRWVNYLSYIYKYEDTINKTGRTPLEYY